MGAFEVGTGIAGRASLRQVPLHSRHRKSTALAGRGPTELACPPGPQRQLRTSHGSPGAATPRRVDRQCHLGALLAEPTLGPVQTLEVYDPFVAKIEAVLEHRRMLVAIRTLALHHVQVQIAKLPTEIRDQLCATGKIESRLRRLEGLDVKSV